MLGHNPRLHKSLDWPEFGDRVPVQGTSEEVHCLKICPVGLLQNTRCRDVDTLELHLQDFLVWSDLESCWAID